MFSNIHLIPVRCSTHIICSNSLKKFLFKSSSRFYTWFLLLWILCHHNVHEGFRNFKYLCIFSFLMSWFTMLLVSYVWHNLSCMVYRLSPFRIILHTLCFTLHTLYCYHIFSRLLFILYLESIPLNPLCLFCPLLHSLHWLPLVCSLYLWVIYVSCIHSNFTF